MHSRKHTISNPIESDTLQDCAYNVDSSPRQSYPYTPTALQPGDKKIKDFHLAFVNINWDHLPPTPPTTPLSPGADNWRSKQGDRLPPHPSNAENANIFAVQVASTSIPSHTTSHFVDGGIMSNDNMRNSAETYHHPALSREISESHAPNPMPNDLAELCRNSLNDTINTARDTRKQLEYCISQIESLIPWLSQQIAANYDRPGKVHRDMEKDPRLFGQALPTTITGDSELAKPKLMVGSETAPWFLRIDLDSEISYGIKDDKYIIKSGTLAGLVENLTRHDRLNASFSNTFLLTYRSFTSASDLYEIMVRRFSVQPPFGLNSDEMQTWIDRKQKPIRFQVVNILRSWIDDFWVESNDEISRDVLQRLHEFTKTSIATANTPGYELLLVAIEQRLCGQDTTVKRLLPTHNAAAPSASAENVEKLGLFKIDHAEFARQLTIIEFRLYSKIRPTEFFSKIWQKKAGTETVSGINALINHSNQLSSSVAEIVLEQDNVKDRVLVIEYFVKVAEECGKLGNYSSLNFIIAALGMTPISRLQKTWSEVNPQIFENLKKMNELMASARNFSKYREELNSANPSIPFLGVILNDLTCIKEAIPPFTESGDINFEKCVETAKVIWHITGQYQNIPDSLQDLRCIQIYIQNRLKLKSAHDHDQMYLNTLYERSYKIEPQGMGGTCPLQVCKRPTCWRPLSLLSNKIT